MSKMKQLTELINEMEGTAKYYLRLVDEFRKLLSTEEENATSSEKQQTEPQKELKLEDVRAILATKAKDGYKNEVRALLNKYGAESLSALATEHYAVVLKEAGGIGHD